MVKGGQEKSGDQSTVFTIHLPLVGSMQRRGWTKYLIHSKRCRLTITEKAPKSVNHIVTTPTPIRWLQQLHLSNLSLRARTSAVGAAGGVVGASTGGSLGAAGGIVGASTGGPLGASGGSVDCSTGAGVGSTTGWLDGGSVGTGGSVGSSIGAGVGSTTG